MEVALVARDEGAEIHYLNLRDQLPRIEDHTWLPRRFDVNSFRVAQAKPLLRREGIKVVELPSNTEVQAASLDRAQSMLDGCRDLAALRALRYGEFKDIGWGVLSSVIELSLNPFVDLTTHRKEFRDFLASSLLAYDMVRAQIEALCPDAVLLFNGRFATTRPIFRAAENAGVRRLIHERGSDCHHYWLASESIHDPDYIQQEIRRFWRPELSEVAHSFFTNRRQRVEKAWYSFVKSQRSGKLPEAMRGDGRWVVFFSASDDEYVATGDKYEVPEFPTQRDAIMALVEAVRRVSGYRLCVRLHPNIARKSREQRDYWAKLKIPDGIVIAPEDDPDSYAMLDRAEVICSYGSTMGIEATYWGKPSLLLGRSIYDRLGVCHCAFNIDEIAAFLLEPRTFPRDGTLVYGGFFSSFGTPYRYYQARNFRNGKILGHDLDALPVRWFREARDGLRRTLRLR